MPDNPQEARGVTPPQPEARVVVQLVDGTKEIALFPSAAVLSVTRGNVNHRIGIDREVARKYIYEIAVALQEEQNRLLPEVP
jgi:hypothetical protein